MSVDELGLTAEWGEDGTEPMTHRLTNDRDSFKKVYLLFENDSAKFPLYPDMDAVIRYRYHVRDDKWGQWFQREIRFLTRSITMRLDLPAAVSPLVWGTYTPMTAQPGPFATPIRRVSDGDRAIFEWSTSDPPLQAEYRMEWRFAEHDELPNAYRPRLTDNAA